MTQNVPYIVLESIRNGKLKILGESFANRGLQLAGSSSTKQEWEENDEDTVSENL